MGPDIDWLKAMPPMSSTAAGTLPSLAGDSDEHNPNSQLQHMLLTMPPPPVGQRMTMAPVGAPPPLQGSMAAFPRGLMAGLQHTNHIGLSAADVPVDHSTAMLHSLGRPPMYHNGLAGGHLPNSPAANMFPTTVSSVGHANAANAMLYPSATSALGGRPPDVSQMYPSATSNVGRATSDGLPPVVMDSSGESWSNVQMKMSASSGQLSTDQQQQRPMWSNIWTSPPNF
jgi:hypothetical protein